MIFEKDKEIEALGRTHYNAKFQNDISFRIVKNNNTNWKLMVCMYSSQLGLDNSKFIENGQCKTLSEAKDWCEEIAERFAKDTGIDKQTIEIYNKNSESIAELHNSLTPNRIYELINKYFVKGKDTVDIGCGIGRDVNWLNLNDFPTVGVDASDGMIKEAKKLYPTLEFKLDYLPALNCFDNEQFTNILCSAVLMHMDENAVISACLRMSQLLKSNGYIIISFRGTASEDDRENGKLYSTINIETVKQIFEQNNCEILLYETEIEPQRKLTWHNLVIKKYR